jgi:Na+/H+-dicarboxylate symporter
LATILGIEPEQEQRLLELTSELLASDDPDLQRPGEDRREANAAVMSDFVDMFHTIIEDRRAAPRDDLATMLATATLENGEPLTETETLGYYLTTDVIALSLGIGAAALLRPGNGMQLTEEVAGPVGEVPGVAEILLDMIPTNVFRAFSDGNVVQLVVLALLLGVATMALQGGARDRLATVYEDLANLFRRLVHMILWTAPVGIGALIAVTVGRYGAELLGPMARFLGGLWAAQLVIFAGYMILLRCCSDFRPGRFLRDTGSLWATTAATTSSLASLSVGMETARRLGLPRGVFSFTLPLGAQLNKDGTSAMLGAVLIFTAQAAGVTFTPADFVAILLLGLLLSEASGGIPGGGFVIALIYVQAFNLPIEVAAIVGGIYRLVDIGNTTVNIMGDMVGTSLVARSEARRS